MREVAITTWCDACDAARQGGARKAPVLAAGTWELRVGTAAPMSLDLCDRHAAALVDPLADLLNSHGQPIDPPTPKPYKRKPYVRGTFPCPTCDYVAETRQGLGSHRARSHGYRKGDDAGA